jgi:TIR domain
MDDAAPIFVSYRRSDAAGHARVLHEYLSGRFGVDQIFFDRSTIEGGDVFPDTLRRGVEGCAALIALIAPDWLDVAGADGGRRLDDPDDFVRQEIALALERGKKVIPLLFEDTPVPSANRLPDH